MTLLCWRRRSRAWGLTSQPMRDAGLAGLHQAINAYARRMKAAGSFPSLPAVYFASSPLSPAVSGNPAPAGPFDGSWYVTSNGTNCYIPQWRYNIAVKDGKLVGIQILSSRLSASGEASWSFKSDQRYGGEPVLYSGTFHGDM